MRTVIKKTIEEIVRIDLQPSAAAKGLFPNFCDNEK